MRNIRKKEKQKNMCQNAFFSCLQGIKCIDLQKRNRICMYDQLKRRFNSQRKNAVLYLEFCF